MEKELELKGLDQFCGTEKYVNVLGANVTDGVGYIMKSGYSWFVTDFLAVRKTGKMVGQPFLAIKLELNGTKAKMAVTDGNEKVLYEQKYGYTDAKRSFTLYFVDNVLMLSGEY